MWSGHDFILLGAGWKTFLALAITYVLSHSPLAFLPSFLFFPLFPFIFFLGTCHSVGDVFSGHKRMTVTVKPKLEINALCLSGVQHERYAKVVQELAARYAVQVLW